MLKISQPLKLFTIVFAGIFLAAISSPVATTAAGRTANSVVNTLLNGKGVPSASLGINGDFYIDKAAMNLYGPKAQGKWPLPVSMRGAVGPMGPVGVDGKTGDKGTTASSIAGATGSKGETGATGATGAPGSGGSGATGATGATGIKGDAGPSGASGLPGASGNNGATGPSGTNGANGTTGATGATGIKGDAGQSGASGLPGASGNNGATGPSGTNGTNGLNGSNGVTGATGLAGSTGDRGFQGAQGNDGAIGNTGTKGETGERGMQGMVGETGTTGATGPSEVAVFNIGGPGGIDPWTFSTATGGSTETISSDFGNLQANMSYRFTIVLTGYVNVTGWSGYSVGSILRYTGGPALLNSTAAYSQGKVLMPGALRRFQFTYLYEGTIVAGPNGNNLNVSVIDGENWSNGFFTNGLKIVGTAYIQLVGRAIIN